jgi:hypothetical protein
MLAFALLAAVWSWPLALHIGTHVPGAGPSGDNIDFLWNFWWMRTALSSGTTFFHTSYLFAPWGVDLTLHTHDAAPAFMGATLLRGLTIVSAQDWMILLALFLNGYGGWLLAWRVTGDNGAALFAGMVFGGSPYVAAHLNGHFDLINVWTLALFVATAAEMVRSGALRWAVIAGLLLGVTAYVDYYYVVYQAVLLVCLVVLAAGEWSVTLRGASRRTLRVSHVVAVLILCDVVLLAAIGMTGGFAMTLGPVRVSARDVFNPFQAFWVLAALFVWSRTRPHVQFLRAPAPTGRRLARATLVVVGLSLMAAAPLVWRGVFLLLRGEYVAPTLFWRSGTRGVDLSTWLLGNPYHGWLGQTTRAAYAVLGVDAIEAVGWPGVAPMLLAGWAALSVHTMRPPRRRALRDWTAVGVVFLVWALGPHLMLFGINTGMPLPDAVFRYLPVFSNVRIPGRAIVVSYLTLAVVSAIAVSEWRHRSPRPHLVVLVAALAVAVDFIPAPFPLTPLNRPGLYETLRERPELGAVCELPLGIRDGFGQRGTWDDRTLFYQTIHERPLVGGFVARLSPSLVAAYERDPLLSALLRLSSRPTHAETGPPLPDRLVAARQFREDHIAFVVLNRATASPALVDYAQRVLPLQLVASDGSRSLYAVMN